MKQLLKQEEEIQQYKNLHIDIHTHAHTYTHTHIRTHIRTHAQCTHTHTRHTHTCTRCTHTHKHKHTMHTHSIEYTRIQLWSQLTQVGAYLSGIFQSSGRQSQCKDPPNIFIRFLTYHFCLIVCVCHAEQYQSLQYQL